MPRELILEEWNRFYIKAYPHPLTAESLVHIRRAFYAGATAMLATIVGGIEAVTEGKEENVIDRIVAVKQELRTFAESF